jgi:hypothetical protein
MCSTVQGHDASVGEIMPGADCSGDLFLGPTFFRGFLWMGHFLPGKKFRPVNPVYRKIYRYR